MIKSLCDFFISCYEIDKTILIKISDSPLINDSTGSESSEKKRRRRGSSCAGIYPVCHLGKSCTNFARWCSKGCALRHTCRVPFDPHFGVPTPMLCTCEKVHGIFSLESFAKLGSSVMDVDAAKRAFTYQALLGHLRGVSAERITTPTSLPDSASQASLDPSAEEAMISALESESPFIFKIIMIV
eukprot:TRINITY_DN13560_c0_g1_i1.p1 TRINITY_DN13560_c0_g1~~TRINITY_DN13560_c0_g1_i1.p1  ORF type:complete len:185 (+),score=23.98 TRINITY_DN13560_c0_g1_i1:486-1040(+)